MEWSRVATIAKEAFRAGANQWLSAARLSSGGTLINGHTLQLLAPCIGNNFDLNAFLARSMTQSGVPTRLVRPIAEELSSAWKSWPGSVSGSVPGAFAAFDWWPGPVARGVLTRPLPLSIYLNGDPFPKESTILMDLTQDTAGFANAATGNRADALKTVAAWVSLSFRNWKNHALMFPLFGEGPVPSFAPPTVPAGPVVGGKARSTGPLFVGRSFGEP